MAAIIHSTLQNQQGTYLSSVEYFDNKKGSDDTENHCGYLISLVSTETPSVKTV